MLIMFYVVLFVFLDILTILMKSTRFQFSHLKYYLNWPNQTLRFYIIAFFPIFFTIIHVFLKM